MWPFGNSKTARRESVVQFALDAATLSFGTWLADGRLVRAMQADPYVLGYVLTRLQGLVRHAAIDAKLADESATLGELALHAFFGTAAQLLPAAAAAPVQAAGRERWLAGIQDGSAQCEYLFGVRAVRDHPHYADAAARERLAAAAMPANRFNGSDAAVAHHLEHVTFAAYFEREHPPIPAAHACSSAA